MNKANQTILTICLIAVICCSVLWIHKNIDIQNHEIQDHWGYSYEYEYRFAYYYDLYRLDDIRRGTIQYPLGTEEIEKRDIDWYTKSID